MYSSLKIVTVDSLLPITVYFENNNLLFVTAFTHNLSTN